MKQKILKLIKKLEKFKLEDIVALTELNEKTVNNYINDLLSENKICKISKNEYAYLPEIINKQEIKGESKKGLYKKPIYQIDLRKEKLEDINPEELFPKKEEVKFFNNAKDYDKRNIVKVLTIFKLAGNLRGESLRKFLIELSDKHPEYKMSYSTFVRYYRQYFTQGIRGLCLKYANYANVKTAVHPEMYEVFKKYYLSTKKYSIATAYKIVCKNFPDSDIPSDKAFYRLLLKEYKPEHIKQLREAPINLPELSYNFKKKKDDKKLFEKFIDAANYHYDLLDKKNTEVAICQKGYIKNHLIPYFEGYKFRDITQDVVINYESKMVALGYSMASIRRFLSVFSIIFSKYSECAEDLKFVADNTPIPSLEISYYTDKEIKEIIENKKPELWILCLGITPAELSALRYEDIDKNNRTVFIQRAVFQGVEQPHRAKYRKRHLIMPSIIFKDIDFKKKGLIFKDIKIENYDKLINTHIHLLLEKNVQINIISKNLGFHNIKDFTSRYNFLLPQKLDDNFEILQN